MPARSPKHDYFYKGILDAVEEVIIAGSGSLSLFLAVDSIWECAQFQRAPTISPYLLLA